jgi:hypothetical protein
MRHRTAARADSTFAGSGVICVFSHGVASARAIVAARWAAARWALAEAREGARWRLRAPDADRRRPATQSRLEEFCREWCWRAQRVCPCTRVWRARAAWWRA